MLCLQVCLTQMILNLVVARNNVLLMILFAAIACRCRHLCRGRRVDDECYQQRGRGIFGRDTANADDVVASRCDKRSFLENKGVTMKAMCQEDT